MTKDFGIDSSLRMEQPVPAQEYILGVVASLQDLVGRSLRLEDQEQTLTYVQKLYSPAMLGTCVGLGQQFQLRPTICALYMIHIVSKLRLKESTSLGRFFSSDKRVLHDAHTVLFDVSDEFLKTGKNWDSGVFGVYLEACMRTHLLGESDRPPTAR